MQEYRTYSEEEIAALLQRSAQLQADDTRAEKKSQSAGLTLTELETIARESGMDPSYLHRAALEMEMSKGKPSMPKKSDTHIYVDRFFSGELTDEIWEEIVFELRRKYESSSSDMYGSTLGKGITEQIGRSREWRVTSFSGVQTTVLFRPAKKGGTRVELSQRVGVASTKAESILYGVFTAFFPALIALAATKSLAWGSAWLLALTALFIPVVYYLDTLWRNKKLRQLNETGDRLIEMMENGLAEGSSSAVPLVSSTREDSLHGETLGGDSLSQETIREPKEASRLDLPELEETHLDPVSARSRAKE